MSRKNDCECADCAHQPPEKYEAALEMVGGLLGTQCVFARALFHMEVLLRVRERSMDPRLLTKKVARLMFCCGISHVKARRNKVGFLMEYYQLHGAPMEGVHVLGFDYYYGPQMQVSRCYLSLT